MRRLDPHSLSFTLLAGALVTLASFATDMGLPVLAETGAALGVSAATAALTLSVFMVGFATGPLAFGPLSDRVGRRPVLLAALGAFALCGALAALSHSLGALLAWRFLMGAGAGACQVVMLATVRDLFVGNEARAKQSYINLAAGVAPIIAPTVGVWVAGLGGWRTIYLLLAVGGAALLGLVALRLGESSPRVARPLLASYRRAVRHPVTIGYALVVALLFGALFAYVSSSSLVLIGVMGVPRRLYGVLFAVTSAGLMLGSLTNARLARRGVSHRRLIAIGLTTIVAVALTLLALAAADALRPSTLVPLVVVSFVAHGVVRPNAAQGALEPMADIAGVASAVLTGLQMLVGAIASAAAAALFDGRSAVGMTATMAVCAAGAAATYFFVVRPAERERRSANRINGDALDASDVALTS